MGAIDGRKRQTIKLAPNQSNGAGHQGSNTDAVAAAISLSKVKDNMSASELNDIPSKLRPLMKAFQSAPFNVAPERDKELLVLRDKYDIRIYLKADAEDWLFQEFRLGKRIFVGLRTLERLWAYCYGYNTIVTELQKAALAGVEQLQNQGEYKLAFYLLDWASQKKLADIEGDWPDLLPDPSLVDELEHVKTANHIFLMMSGRLLLHELAHTVLGHSNAPDTPPDVLKREEFEADAWADNWMLEKWKDYKSDEKVFIGRCLGIAFANAPPLILGLDAKSPSASHPSPIERIVDFAERNSLNGNPNDQRPIDFPCAFLTTIAAHLVFMRHKTAPVMPIPKTYKEWFRRFASYFP
jgi:Peptidase U49